MGGSKKSRIIPARPIKGDVRQNRHRFRGFHERIATLKIDPIRTARAQDEKSTESYFKARFEFWREINLSEPFADFSREISPFSDSLTQILYYEQKIADILIGHLQKQNVLSLEPLLDLTSQLAHDLDHRFEKHYARVVSVLAIIVSSHQDVEVLEWSFNTLAWMFQFLSKLLVPDLRPTYNILAPLLGKEVRKGHIARFAAEAMSFLLRKAAWRMSRDLAPLELIVKHVLQDWSAYCSYSDDVEVFSYGLMNLFVDCIKDIKKTDGIRPDGVGVFRFLLKESLAIGDIVIVKGVLINLMHHTNLSTFEGLQDEIISQIATCDQELTKDSLLGWLNILDTTIEVRNGQRISNWESLFISFENLLNAWSKLMQSDASVDDLTSRTAAALIQCSPFDVLASQLNKMMARVLEMPDVRTVSTFFLFAWDLNSKRFEELLRPFLFKFLANRAGDTDDELRQLFTLQMILSEEGIDWRASNTPKTATQAWQKRIVTSLKGAKCRKIEAFRVNAAFSLTGLLPANAEACNEIESELTAQIKALTHPRQSLATGDGMERFLFGNALKWYLQYSSISPVVSSLSWEDLFSVWQDFGKLPLYVGNLVQLLDDTAIAITESAAVQSSIMSNFATGSSQLRLISARLLRSVRQKLSLPDGGVFDVMVRIEESSLTHSSVRFISMQIRRLAELYLSLEQHETLREAIIYHCFGLLSLNLTPVWKDVLDTLKLIYGSGEDRYTQLIEDLVFRCLEGRQSRDGLRETTNEEDDNLSRRTTEFECTNYNRQTRIYKKRLAEVDSAKEGARNRFASEHRLVDSVPAESSSQALRVLTAVPSLAEKRSRRLVPLFLSWASAEDDSDDTLVGDVSPVSGSTGETSSFSRVDKLEMLNVFGMMTNPRSLYRANDVYQTLLNQLSSGDVRVQKAALKALATWKTSGLKIYREHLDNLLDNARFREELTMFLPSKMEEKGLNMTDRAEMIRVLLPLLFGRVTAKGKSSAGKMTQEARRRAVFESLATFPDEDLFNFLEIALGPLKSVEVRDKTPVLVDASSSSISLRRQAGFVRLAKDMLDCVGDKLEPSADQLIPALIFCLRNAQSVRSGGNEDDSEQIDEDNPNHEGSVLKSTRRAGLQCLTLISQKFSKPVVDAHIDAILENAVVPRLGAAFAAENAQSVSGLLRLFATWTSNHQTAPYFTQLERLLPQLVDCLQDKQIIDFNVRDESAPTLNLTSTENEILVKSPVKLYIINDILQPFFATQAGNGSPLQLAVGRLEHIISAVVWILQKDRGTELAASAVSLALQVAPYLAGSLSPQLVELLLSMVDMPQKQVSTATKTTVLALVGQCIPQILSGDRLGFRTFETLSKQFLTSDPSFRQQLCQTFMQLGQAMGSKFESVAQLCKDMNSISSEKLDDPDLASRSRAFERVLLPGFQPSDMEWSPLVHNALHFLKDQDETFVRKNAAAMLRRFIQSSADIHQDGGKIYPTSKTLRGVVLPALRRGANEKNELVRVEYIFLMEHLIMTCPTWSEVSDLVPLVDSTDDNESVLSGLSHIQQDWRNKSLVKLARFSRQGQLGSENIAHFLMPLIEHFVFERDEDSQANPLAAQAMTTIGALSLSLEWEQVRKSLRRYTSIIKENPDVEKSAIRLVGVITEAIHETSMSEDSTCRLAVTMADRKVLQTDINEKLLPPIVAFLRHKDESVVSLRVPMAVSAVRLICLLSHDEVEVKLAPVLTDVCNILRSKAQESRDLSRKTLAEITALIGPNRFSFILKELRIALGRGYQLHVKSYTLHSLLVACDFRNGELDYCLSDILQIILDDIFGTVGQEKDADGYTNKAKEVKGSKSMDSAERIARISSIECVKEFINPIRGFLMERLDAKAVGKVDELLRRITLGLQQNQALGTRAALIFCYQVLDQARRVATAQISDRDGLSRGQLLRTKKFEVRMKNSIKSASLPQVSSQVFKLARFALDLLRTILQRHEDLRTPSNLSGFLPVVGDILLDAQEEVQISALRLLSSVMKMPMKQWADNITVYTHTAFTIVQNERDTNTELSQAAIKLITAVLRDRPEVDLKDSRVGALVKSIIPDLTQPARQGVTFNLLKAVVARLLVNNEVYQAMDVIAQLFVTYSDGSARNQARSIWLQFVVNYEQSEKRFNQQISFLAQNLTFEHMEGRQSVMEAIHFLLEKLDLDHQRKAGLMLFLPVVDRIVGDEVTSCREMASLLLKTILQTAGEENLKLFCKILQRLFSQPDNEHGTQAALQVYGIFIEAEPEKLRQDVGMLIGWLEQTLPKNGEFKPSEWETVYAALQLALKLSQSFDQIIANHQHSHLWNTIWDMASFPHAWVKGQAAKLIQTHLNRFDVSMLNSSTDGIIRSKFGVQLDQQRVVDLARAYFKSLWQEPPEWLVTEIIRNLDMLELIANRWHIKINLDSIDIADVEDNLSDGEGNDTDTELLDKDSRVEDVSGLYFRRISAILRRDSPLNSKVASLGLIATLVDRLPVVQIEKSLPDILRPLNQLTDSSVPRMTFSDSSDQEKQQTLRDASHEILFKLQKKMADHGYMNVMQNVQQESRRKREERRSKRRIEAVADPAKASREKMKKRERGRDRKKEMNSVHRSRRLGY